jgi:hypothetical protein
LIELEHGVIVYPPREGESRWRAVFYEEGSGGLDGGYLVSPHLAGVHWQAALGA